MHPSDTESFPQQMGQPGFYPILFDFFWKAVLAYLDFWPLYDILLGILSKPIWPQKTFLQFSPFQHPILYKPIWSKLDFIQFFSTFDEKPILAYLNLWDLYENFVGQRFGKVRENRPCVPCQQNFWSKVNWANKATCWRSWSPQLPASHQRFMHDDKISFAPSKHHSSHPVLRLTWDDLRWLELQVNQVIPHLGLTWMTCISYCRYKESTHQLPRVTILAPKKPQQFFEKIRMTPISTNSDQSLWNLFKLREMANSENFITPAH